MAWKWIYSIIIVVFSILECGSAMTRLPMHDPHVVQRHSWWEVVDGFVSRLESYRRTPVEMEDLRRYRAKKEGDREVNRILRMARREQEIKKLRQNIEAHKRKNKLTLQRKNKFSPQKQRAVGGSDQPKTHPVYAART